jgi:hypothetical protein
MRTFRNWLIAMMALAATGLAVADTTFTYQGRLDQSGSPHSGSPNMDFRLFDSLEGGMMLAEITKPSVPVVDGLFQVELDFGDAYASGPRWLEVRVNGASLTPRQPIQATPIAIHALGGGDGIESVSSNSTLSGDGTPGAPLGVTLGGLNHQHLQNPPGGRQSSITASSFPVTHTVSSFSSVTLNIPASGYVLILGSANMALGHTAGQTQNVLVGVGQSPTIMSGLKVVRIPGSAPAGDYWIPVTVQSFESVSPGTRTFYLNARDNLGGSPTGGIQLNSPHITAIYLPVLY